MDSAPKPQQAVCGKEALELLNCIAQNPYDEPKCLNLLQSLRQCVISKKVKKFSLAEPEEAKVNANTTGDKQP